MEITPANKKRAANMVWTAADRYDFAPPFLFYDMQDEPSLYLNTLVGLGYQALDHEYMETFLLGIESSHDAANLLPLALLVLGEVIYRRQLEERPSLEALRHEYAEYRLTELGNPAKYKPMSQQRQQILLLRAVLDEENAGRPENERYSYPDYPYPNYPYPDYPFKDRERDLARDLQAAGRLDDEKEIAKRIKEILWHYYMYKYLPGRRKEDAAFLGVGFLSFLAGGDGGDSFGGRGLGADESLEGTGEMGRRWRLFLRHLVGGTSPDEDREFVELSFGECLLPAHQMNRITADTCKGLHKPCRLWYAGAESTGKEAGRERELQHRQNLEYYNKNKRFYDRSIEKIASRLKHALEEKLEPDSVHVQSGILEANRVYRVKYLHDLDIFHREIVHPTPEFSVDLLIDASSSRFREQESIATQGYMITRSLMKLGIPVQVTTFRSMRRYTILQRLTAYDDNEDGAQKIFHFFTAGSNRDGLALRAMQPIMEKTSVEAGQEVRQRILLVLTDASPADVQKAYLPDKLPHMQDYDGKLAVDDTREAILKLRQDGTKVAAIFWGLSSSVPDLRMMFGDNFIRISEIEQLPEAVIGLLVRIIGELR